MANVVQTLTNSVWLQYAHQGVIFQCINECITSLCRNQAAFHIFCLPLPRQCCERSGEHLVKFLDVESRHPSMRSTVTNSVWLKYTHQGVIFAMQQRMHHVLVQKSGHLPYLLLATSSSVLRSEWRASCKVLRCGIPTSEHAVYS